MGPGPSNLEDAAESFAIRKHVKHILFRQNQLQAHCQCLAQLLLCAALSPLLPVLITNFGLDRSARECCSALKLAATVVLLDVFYPLAFAVYPDPADHRSIGKLD
jgi:hypothetical protein